MFKIISKSLWLLLFSVVICCVIYPLILLAIGQTVFPFQANGSIVNGPDGKPVGSLLIAQPFAKPEAFHAAPVGDLDAVRCNGILLRRHWPYRIMRCGIAWPTRSVPSPHIRAGQRKIRTSVPTSRSGSTRTSSKDSRRSSPNGPISITAWPKDGLARRSMPRIRLRSSSTCWIGKRLPGTDREIQEG